MIGIEMIGFVVWGMFVYLLISVLLTPWLMGPELWKDMNATEVMGAGLVGLLWPVLAPLRLLGELAKLMAQEGKK